MKTSSKTAVLLMIIALAISCLLLFGANPYYGHDIGFHLSRIQSIADCFSDKTFPALIYPRYFNEYGYANGIFYPDLFLYIPAFLVYLGIDCKFSYNTFLFVVNISTLLSMYFCTRKIVRKDLSASLISCLYLLSSYRITDLYVRSALGETLCFVFFPFILLGLYEILYAEKEKGYYLIIGLFGVLSSHIISLLFCVILIILFYIVSFFRLIKNKVELIERTRSLFINCLLSVAVCAFFILPFLEMMFSDSFMYKVNPATGGWDRTIPFLYSIIEIPSYRTIFFPLGIGIIFIVLFIMYAKTLSKNKTERFVIDYLAFGILFWLMSTNLFPWALCKGFAQTIQFPWRFLAVSTASLLFGFAPTIDYYLSNENSAKKTVLLLLITNCLSLMLFAVDMFIFEDYEQYTDEIHYSTGGNEYLPADVDLQKIAERGLVISSNDPNIKTSFEKRGTNMVISYENASKTDAYIEVPLIYYKGYKATENHNYLTVLKGDNGILRINLTNSSGVISVYYGATLLRKIGYGISLLSLVYLFLSKHKSQTLNKK